ncbi:MAG TPA: glycosyltransferase family 4 protein [Acidimicrobiales bacterium]|nr:glycosyltransferase family 4 protein [Acidimicrobiales bacterium]
MALSPEQSPAPSDEPVVVHLISSVAGVGGAEKVVAALARGAADHGWRSVVVNPFAGPDQSATFRALYGSTPYVARTTYRPQQLPGVRGWTADQLARHRPSIVHVHLFHATMLAATMRRPSGARWLLTHHHGALDEWQGRRARAVADRWACRRLRPVVAVSEQVRAYLLERCRLPPDDVIMIRNGWSGEPRRSALSGSPPTAVCVANFRPEKGHLVLLEAFRQSLPRVPLARLVLVGAGPLESTIRRRITELGLDDAVTMAGPVSDVWPILEAADLFVLASWHEGLGIAVQEAMAAGLPVVATATGGLRGLVEHNETGWLVEPGDAPAMAQRIIDLLRDAELRRRFGNAGHASAMTMRDTAMVGAYYDFYRILLGSRGSRR